MLGSRWFHLISQSYESRLSLSSVIWLKSQPSSHGRLLEDLIRPRPKLGACQLGSLDWSLASRARPENLRSNEPSSGRQSRASLMSRALAGLDRPSEVMRGSLDDAARDHKESNPLTHSCGHRINSESAGISWPRWSGSLAQRDSSLIDLGARSRASDT